MGCRGMETQESWHVSRPANKTFSCLKLIVLVEVDRQVGWGRGAGSVGANPNVKGLADLLRLCAYRAFEEFNLGSHISDLCSQDYFT